MFSAVQGKMDSVREVVLSGESDALLAGAIYASGRRAFVRECARGFARSFAARGDVSAASEIVRVHASGAARKGWCTGATLSLARQVCGTPDIVHVQCDGEDEVMIKPCVVSGDDEDAVEGLSAMMTAGCIAEALAHARIIGITAPSIVFDAVMGTEISVRTKQYIALLKDVYHLVGMDREARKAILDAAVAFGSSGLRVLPPSVKETEERMRIRALYTATRPARHSRARRRAPDVSEVRCLDIEGMDEEAEQRVEVVKCWE
jgi:hypothetical protein